MELNGGSRNKKCVLMQIELIASLFFVDFVLRRRIAAIKKTTSVIPNVQLHDLHCAPVICSVGLRVIEILKSQN